LALRAMLTPRVSTVGETLSFTKSKAIELYSLAKAQEFHYWWNS